MRGRHGFRRASVRRETEFPEFPRGERGADINAASCCRGAEAQHEFSSEGSERPAIGYDEGFQEISSRLDAGRSRGQETGNAALGVPESHG